MATKRIYFVRHGETPHNKERIYQSDRVPLSEKGIAGAKAVADRLSTLPLDIMIASTFVRAQETAQAIELATGLSILTSPLIHEVLNARYIWGVGIESEEGKRYAQERREGFTTKEWHPDGAENYFMVSARVEATIAMLAAQAHEHIVVVSHGNFIRFLTARLLLQKQDDLESNMAVYRSLDRMQNAGITEFTYTDGMWKLFTWNDHAHFAE